MPEKTISAPTRRSVAKGIAWSAPVIAAASLAPFAAASTYRCATVEPSNDAAACGLNAKEYTQVNYSNLLSASDRHLLVTQKLQLLLPVGTTLTIGQSITLTIEIGGVETSLIPSLTLDPVMTQLAVTFSKTDTDSGTQLQVVITAEQNYTFEYAVELLLSLKIPVAALATINLGEVLGDGISIQLTTIKTTGDSGCGGVEAALGSVVKIPLPVIDEQFDTADLVSFVTGLVAPLLATGVKVCIPVLGSQLTLHINL